MKIHRIFYTFLENRSNLVRYLFIGAWNATFSLTFYFAVLYYFGDSLYQLTLFLTFIVSTMQSYLTQNFFVWRLRKFSYKQFGHFFVTCVIQYFLNALAMYFLVSRFHLSPRTMQIQVSFYIALGSYFYFKNRVFQLRQDIRYDK